ncbi:MAG TPA: glycoside hydrolase domain-containing protein, partial [Chryseosolibacter sp.]
FIDQEGQGPSSSLQITSGAEPLHFTTRYSIAPGKTIAEEIPFELPVEGSYYASATAKLMGGTLVRRTVDYWFTIEPNRKDLGLLRARAGESLALMARVSNPLAARLRTEAMEILSRLDGLEKSAATKWQTGKWDALTAEVRKMDGDVARHLHEVRSAALHNWKTENDFGISLTHSVIKLRKDGLFPLPLTEQVDLSMARNEYESFQLAILPFGKDLDQINIDVSDLSNKEGNTIEKKHIGVSRVDYNKIDWRAAYVTEYEGWHPDPLIPYRGGLKISGDEVCRPFWITVYAPPGTKPGEYSGTVSVTATGLKKMTATIRCRVWDFELPVASHLKTHSWDQLSYFRDFYNVSEYPVEWYERFCELLLKNRFNPGSAGVNYVNQEPDRSGQYDFSAVEKVLGFCIERGLTRFSIIQMKKGLYTDEEAAKVYRFVEAYARFLRRKGWLDKALIELWDEPTDLEWPYIKERAEKLKQIDPGLRLQLFAEGGPYDFWDTRMDQFGLNKLVDIWAPVNSVEAPQSQAEGKEVWAYFCTLARESAPNFYIDCPAIYQRSIAWYCWMYGLDGFEHWGTNYFWRNVREGQPMSEKWPNVPWDSRTYFNYNGEGQLVYPGPDGVPYSSIRLENFRDSMEDYEYLFRLRELLSKGDNGNPDARLDAYRQLLLPENYLLYKYPRNIKVTLEHTLRYPDEPERFLDARTKIAKAIEQLEKKAP